MAVCPICGCKTDDIDMVDGSVNGVNKKICSFCERQLHSFENIEQADEGQLRWLNAVLTKEVPQRDEETFNALRDMFAKYQSAEAPQGFVPQGVVPNFASNKGIPNNVNNVIQDKDDIINQLSSRVDALEKEIVTMKHKQIIKTILELGIPIILLIVILIVFFSSGLFDALASIWYDFNNI